MNLSMKPLYCSLLAVAVAGLGTSATARAQGGSCHDPWINQAYNQLYHRAPSGSNTTGECNITLYGGGHWTTFADLENKIVAVRGRATAVQLVAPKPAAPAPVPVKSTSPLVLPSLTAEEMAAAKRNPVVIPPSSAFASNTKVLPLDKYHVDKNGNLANSNGVVVMYKGTFAVAAGGNIVAQGGGNIVAQGGGNIVAQGGGN